MRAKGEEWGNENYFERIEDEWLLIHHHGSAVMVVACRSLCSRIARPRKGLDRRAHFESWQATPIERVEKEQSLFDGRVGEPSSS